MNVCYFKRHRFQRTIQLPTHQHNSQSILLYINRGNLFMIGEVTTLPLPRPIDITQSLSIAAHVSGKFRPPPNSQHKVVTKKRRRVTVRHRICQ